MDGYQMWIMEYRNGRGYMVEPIELKFKEVPEGYLAPEPTLRIDGDMARDLIPELKKAVAGLNWFEDKEDYEASKRIENAMQAHIDSLKLVVDRTLIPLR